MRTFALLALLGTTLALPSPKISSVRKPNRFGRPPQRRDIITNDANTTASSPTTSAPKDNIWNFLTNDEAAGIVGFLHNQTVLNLTAVDDAGDWDNTITVVDLLPPNKTDALSYMDGDGAKPDRYAYASILFGATEEPYAQDFVVGPLPVSSATTYYPYTYGSHSEDAKIRVYDLDDKTDFLSDIAMSMSDIVSDILNATIDTADDLAETFDIWGIDPVWHQPDENGNDRVIFWAGFWRYPESIQMENSTINFDGETLLPQGLYIQCDITGRDQSKWGLMGILYGDEYYSSVDEFRTAWKQSDFKKYEPNYSGDWIGTDQTGETMPLESQAPPLSVQPAGQRFKVDEENRYVEWMDFSFYLTFTRDTGMRLYDVKFKGERILYELGLQEAIAHYAGNDPVQSGTSYLDTYYGFGPYAFSQVPGFDAPLYAYCMNTSFHAAELSKSHRCGISIFEADQNYPMQRHSNSAYVSATKNIALTLRSISTVGNYDYSFDYVFYLDGTMETVVRASGYIQSAFYANNTDYGYQIHDSLSGSMHDHVLTWKADFDIAGQENTLVKHVIEPKDIKYKWNNETRSTMHLVRKEITNEDDGKMNWSANAQEQVVVVNKNATNKYGEPRGYKMMPSRGGAGMHLTITNSSNLLNSQGFATHQYYVCKRKDSELRASNAWNDYDTANPIVDFSKFFDGEDIEQEDIVVYFNLGMHHVPHTGDLPNTVFTTATSGMMILPHNYLLSDPSRQATQQIRIDYNDNTTTDVYTWGHETASGTVNLDQISWDPYSYYGDVAVRKFPYDPQNPFNDTESIDVEAAPLQQDAPCSKGRKRAPFVRRGLMVLTFLTASIWLSPLIGRTPSLTRYWSQSATPLDTQCDTLLTASAGTYTVRLETLVSSLPPSTVWVAEPGASASYFIGSFSSEEWWLSERPFLVVVGQSFDGRPRVYLVTPTFEALRARLLELPEEVRHIARWVEWREDQSPYQVLGAALEDDGETFVLDPMVRHFVGQGLRKVLQEETDEEVLASVSLIRERKTTHEVDLLRCANQKTLHAIRQTRKRMYLGISESQTSNILEEEMAKTGLIGGEGLVLFGEDAALPHGSGTNRRLGESDLILIDAGGKWGGYVSDITRTFALPKSKIPQHYIDLWETVRQAQYAAFEFLKGTNASSPPKLADLDRSARNVVSAWHRSEPSSSSPAVDPTDDASVPDFSIFTHRLGHGIGLEGHEVPYLVRGPLGERRVQSGQVFSLEPGIYLPQDGEEVHGMRGVGVRLEDCFIVTEDEQGRLGGEWLSGPIGAWGEEP
ncbi:hypothetical protein I350_01664 [Cryptococcus amylolentus CBS 6273]|uniref:Amine oxidase n=1 Tax=Cryptococcus amylolentus CBS 6273 TaxID=1296118 RepID=A0A1E3KFJ1_9TREE|nr:hypothetical protein I350_01664 [Cryptococcus amylolentus CBS 6273]